MCNLSVIIPTYNRKAYLSDLLQSISQQTYKDVEVIVIDDCSTDGTDDFITELIATEKMSVVYHRNDCNMGCGYSRRYGFEIAQGEFVIFADDDDYYTDNNFFSNGVEILQKANDLAFVSGNVQFLNMLSGENSIGHISLKGLVNGTEYFRNFQYKWGKPQSTFSTIFRHQALSDAEFSTVKMVNDASIYLRALISGNAYILPYIIGVYRVHDSNISYSLSGHFIVQNLAEKRNVGMLAIQRKIIDNFRMWFYNQAIFTISWRCYSYISFCDIYTIIKWLCKKGYIYVAFVALKCYLKYWRTRFSNAIKRRIVLFR